MGERVYLENSFYITVDDQRKSKQELKEVWHMEVGSDTETMGGGLLTSLSLKMFSAIFPMINQTTRPTVAPHTKG